ncbi:MAG TPA: T9SS type A sorting domain-containing protein, partial [Chitinophagales bacterium]|nr:T9SS type A sorting domain-containing protein [Chitinophagales bacterium]
VMKKQTILLMVCSAVFAASSQTWIRKSDFPGTARMTAASFSMGDKGYVGTGCNGSGNISDFWEYNALNDQWTQKADFTGAARCEAVGVSAGDKGYIGTGETDSSLTNDLFEYIPANDTWVQKTSLPAANRHKAVAFKIGTKIYAGTGTDGLSYYKDFWEYDPVSDTWSQKADFAGNPRISATGFGIGNKGYLGLGFGTNGEYRQDFFEYDPNANWWYRIPDDFPGAGREDAVFVGVDALGKGYLACGFKSLTTYLSDVWEYNQATQEWKPLGAFSGVGRRGAAGFVINNTLYIGLGKDAAGNYLKDFWAFTLPTAIAGVNEMTHTVSPNPVTTRLTVEVSAMQAMFTLFDISGRKAVAQMLVNGKNSILLETLPAGTYYYVLKNSAGKNDAWGKLIKIP